MNNYGKGLIKSVVEDVDKKFIENKYKLSHELNNALKNKYKKVDKNEEKYIELLKFNIIYYKSIIKKLEVIVEVWIQNGVISSPESVEKNIVKITESSKDYVNSAMKEGLNRLTEKDRRIYLSYDKSFGIERLEKIENDYKILNVYKDILGMVITEIASNVEKYKEVLDMGVDEAKIDIMNEIFKLVDDILFSEDPDTSNFENEALIGDDEIEGRDVEDSDKCLSFKKYASMISTPEVLVKINDAFTTSVELEKIKEEDAYVFSSKMKDYVSCIVILLDYISSKDKRFFENLFRLFVIGGVNESQFKEICERYIRANLFLDSKTWLECQKNIKSNFNMENNKFFGEKNLDSSSLEYSMEDNESYIVDIMDLLMDLDGEVLVGQILESSKLGLQDNSNKNKGFASKLKKSLSSFSEKLKMNEEYEEYDDEYDDEYDYDDEDYEYDDEEDFEDTEKGPIKFKNKLMNLFKKEEVESDYDDEYDDEEDLEDIEIDPSIFEGDKFIQDKEVVELLKMREKSRLRESEFVKKEHDKLINERKLTEEINKAGSKAFNEEENIVFNEEDYVYKKGQVEKKEKLENKKVNENNKFKIDNNQEKKIKTQSKQVEDKQSTFERTQRLNADKIRRVTDKTTVIELGKLNRDKKKDPEFDRKKQEDKKISGADCIKGEPGQRNSNSFDELEEMKAMKLEELEEKGRKKSYRNRLDLSLSGKELKDEKENLEKEFLESKENSLKSKFKNIGEKFRIPESDDEVVFSKKKMIRDTVIIVFIVVFIFFAYVFIIKQFKSPSVEETNKNIKVVQKSDKNSNKNTEQSKNNFLNENTSEISKKTEAEKEKDEVESEASKLDRQAQNYKGESGVYYTIFVGATKDKAGAESVAYNFARRGVNAKVVRNGGYYMLKVGEYFNYNQAYAQSRRISAKGIQNYIASQNKYYDLKIAAFQTRIPYLSKEQLKTDYDDLKNQISSTGKNEQYVQNLDEIYENALKERQ